MENYKILSVKVFILLYFVLNVAFSQSIPQDFINFDNKIQESIDVFINNKAAGKSSVNYNYDTNHIKILQPKTLFVLIKKFVNNKIKDDEIYAILNKEHSANINSICKNQLDKNYADPNQEVCEIPHPEKFTFILNPSSKHLFIYINPRYLVESETIIILPKSTVENLTYINKIFFLFSKESVFHQQNKNFNLSSINELSIGNGFLLFNLNYFHNKNDYIDRHNIELGSASWNYYSKKHHIAIGNITTEESLSLPYKKNIGIKIRKNNNLFYSNSNERVFNTLSVYMPDNGILKIFKEDKLIFIKSLYAGLHLVNANNFPNGTYKIRIEIITNKGEKISYSKIFYKFRSMPRNKFDYAFSVGMLNTEDNAYNHNYENHDNDQNYFHYKNNNLSNNTFIYPRIGSIPIYSLKLTKTLRDDCYVDSTFLIKNANDSYLSLSLNKFFNNGAIVIGQMASTNNQYVSSIFTSYEKNKLSVLNSVIWNRNANNKTHNNFLFYQDNNLNLVNEFHYNISEKSSLSLSHKYSIFKTKKNIRVINFSGNYNVFRRNNFNLNVSTQMQHSNSDGFSISLIADIRFMNNSYQIFNHSIRRYTSHDDKNDTFNNSLGAFISKDNVWHHNNIIVGEVINYDDENKYSTLESHIDLTNKYLKYELNHEINKDIHRLYMNFNTALLYSNGNLYLNKIINTNVSGIITHIETNDDMLKNEINFNLIDNENIVESRISSKEDYIVPMKDRSIHNLAIEIRNNKYLLDYDSLTKKSVIYPCNYQFLTFNVKRKILVEALIYDENDKLIPSTKFTSMGESFYTDESGFISARLNINTQKLTANISDHICNIDIAKLDLQKLINYTFIPKLKCTYTKTVTKNKEKNTYKKLQ